MIVNYARHRVSRVELLATNCRELIEDTGPTFMDSYDLKMSSVMQDISYLLFLMLRGCPFEMGEH